MTLLQWNVHSVEMHIHADSKGKVAVDDVTLWTNLSTKCRRNTISRFHLISHYENRGKFFTGNYIL